MAEFRNPPQDAPGDQFSDPNLPVNVFGGGRSAIDAMRGAPVPLVATDPVTGLESGADLSVDANSTSSEVAYRNPGLDVFSVQTIRQSGSITSTLIFTVYFSTTGFAEAAYEASGSAVTFTGADGGVHGLRITGVPWIVVKVTTPQGSAATVSMRAFGGRDAA